MRVSKKHEIRLNEILDAAELLFIEKGYEKATINDILDKVGIGKGTFYHYFKSKEDVMNAVISRMVDVAVITATSIADNTSLNPHEKLIHIIAALDLSQNPNGEIIQELHAHSNVQMHHKSIFETIQAVAPIMGAVVEQGVNEGIYHVAYPRETIEILLVANQFLFDDGIVKWNPEEFMVWVTSFIQLTERALGAAEGSFDFLVEIFQKDANGGAANEK